MALAAWQLPVQEWASQVSPALAVLLGVLLLCALVPRTPISLVFGALFGVFSGAALALVAALLAAVVTYLAGRWAGREVLLKRAGPRIHKLDNWLAQRGLVAVVVVRLLPIAPFGLVGYAYGASSVRFGHYLAGTAIGATPSAISYATIGAAAVSPSSMSWLTFLPAALGIAISTAAALHWRRLARRNPTGVAV
ncbi:MAG TPA: TVP38/TMEM64 family protein [Micromonosporaceae bacterium]|nr:TVP38/TMEM64 family protein [Micromonosporaceae bacterium]HCU49672.1 TVP38/TMEM64 family protein [Micromonosporaceae bacterium]